VVPLEPKLVSSPECSILSGRIGRVPMNSAKWLQDNASCNLGSVPETIGRVPGCSAECLLVHFINISNKLGDDLGSRDSWTCFMIHGMLHEDDSI
jgi:hypothetical protein